MKDYASYIFAAYGLATVVISVATAKICLDYRELKKKLARFETREDKQ